MKCLVLISDEVATNKNYNAIMLNGLFFEIPFDDRSQDWVVFV